MQGDLRVLLVEDDLELCEEFRGCFDETDGIELAAATDSAARALELVRELQPDAVILDLELHNGEGNGISFLSQLGKMKGIKKPFVVINTNNSSQTTYELARRLGAGWIFYKHTQGHSPAVVTDFLLIMSREGAQTGIFSLQQPAASDAGSCSDRRDLKKRIYEELNNVSINPRYKGYDYLADAIEICCGGYVPHVSDMVAELHGKKVKSVEHAMQTAIEKAWDATDTDELYQYYKGHVNPKRTSPTLMEFVRYYAAKLRNDE